MRRLYAAAHNDRVRYAAGLLGIAVIAGAWLEVRARAVPILQAEQTTAEFGRVPRGRMLTVVFDVTNAGASALRLGRVRPECASRAVVRPDSVLKPGARAAVQVDVDTEMVPDGPLARSVVIDTNDPVRSALKLTVRATIASEFTSADT